MDFEWDDAKNQSNIQKHGVSFEEARQIFSAPILTMVDERQEYREVRKLSIGRIDAATQIVVTHTERDSNIRLISSRPESRKKGRGSMTKYDRPLSPSEIKAIRDEDIDFSDIPELDETFWQNAELVKPDRTEQITLRIKRSVLEHFRATGKGYQTRINQVLESYVRAREQHR